MSLKFWKILRQKIENFTPKKLEFKKKFTFEIEGGNFLSILPRTLING